MIVSSFVPEVLVSMAVSQNPPHRKVHEFSGESSLPENRK